MNASSAVVFFAMLAMAMGTSLYYPGSYVSGAYAPLAGSAYTPLAHSPYAPLAHSAYSSVVGSYSPVASAYLGYQPASALGYYNSIPVKSYATGYTGIGGYSAYSYPYGVKYV